MKNPDYALQSIRVNQVCTLCSSAFTASTIVDFFSFGYRILELNVWDPFPKNIFRVKSKTLGIADHQLQLNMLVSDACTQLMQFVWKKNFTRKGLVEMLQKILTKSGRKCRVTFYVPPSEKVSSVNLCGEFNDWNACSHPMEKQTDGSFRLTLKLRTGREYRYRYFVDNYRWITDSASDGAITNKHNTIDSIIDLKTKSFVR